MSPLSGWPRFLLLIFAVAATAAGAGAQLPVAGSPWHFLGPQPLRDGTDQLTVGGDVTALAVGSNGALYAATDGGGVWLAAANGAIWTPLTDSAPSLVINALTVAPNGTIYAGTGSLAAGQIGQDGVGLLVSSDGGNTWTVLGGTTFAGSAITGVWADKAGDLAVTAVGPNAGVYWLAQGSATWKEVEGGPAYSLAWDGSELWVGVGGSLRTVTAGNASVQSLPPGIQDAASIITATDGEEVAVLGVTASGSCAGISEGPSVWTSLGCPSNWEAGSGPTGFAFDAAGHLWLGGNGVWEWLGNAWQAQYGIAGGAQAILEGSTGLNLGNADGAWLLPTGSTEWTTASAGLGAVALDSVAVNAAGQIWAVAEPGGLATAPAWTTLLAGSGGGEVAAAAGDINNPGVLYASTSTGLFQSSDGGQSFLPVSCAGCGTNAASAAPLLAVDPADAAQWDYAITGAVIGAATSAATSALTGAATGAAAGSVGIYQCDGATCAAIAGSAPDGATITALAAGPAALVAGDSAGGIFFDAGSGVWQAPQAFAGAPVLAVAAPVAASGAAANEIAVGLGNPSSGALATHLAVSSDGGESWTAIGAYSLPDAPVTAVALDPADPNLIYAGLQTGGVYASEDGGQTWYQLGTGLPNAPVTALTLDTGGRALIAATQGRGAWETELGLAAANVTISGTAQGTVGMAVTLTAAVVNVLGLPVAGATVNWVPSAGSMAVAATTTNSQGQTTDTLTLPATAGPVTIKAAVPGSIPGQGTLVVTAVAAAAADLAVVAGSGQSGIAGQPLAEPLVAEATDSQGNPVAGVTVTFAAGTAGGSFSPANGQATTGGNGQASVSYTLPSQPGPLTITATASAGGTSLLPATFTETANPPPVFTLSLTPATITADVGTTASFTLASSAASGDSQTIAVSCSAPVTGCNVTPGTISPGGSASVTVTTGGLALGANTIEVRGSDGARTAQATATVEVPKPDFTLALTPSGPEADQDSAFALTVTAAAVNGAYAQIALSCPQPGTGCSISPATITPGQSAAVTIAAGTLSPGTGQVTVTGLDATDQETHTATASFVVVAAGMAVAAAPASLSVSAGSSGQLAVTATPQGGLTGLVAFSCSGLPADAACSFSPATATSAGSVVATTLVISTTANSILPPMLPGGWWLWGVLGILALAGIAGWAWSRMGAQGGEISGGIAGWQPALPRPAPRRTRGGWEVACLAAWLLATALLAGCGGGGSAPADPPAAASGTPRGTYTVQVKATSGTVSARASITLQIN